MRLWAISDLHVGFEVNRAAVEAMADHGDDWLIVAGDTGDTLAQLTLVLDVVTRRFAKGTKSSCRAFASRFWKLEKRVLEGRSSFSMRIQRRSSG